VRELGAEIAADYAGREPLLAVVLRGAFVFASDLSRATPIPHALDFLSLAGYGGPLGGRSAVRLMKDLDTQIEDRHVIVVENVVDTGLTLNYLLKALALRKPADVAVCALLDRPYRRLVEDLPMRYVGFTAPDEFFVGYGFSLEGRYRGLPDLRVLERAQPQRG
jgi:hypoxanthine phosphoribosyltransferase